MVVDSVCVSQINENISAIKNLTQIEIETRNKIKGHFNTLRSIIEKVKPGLSDSDYRDLVSVSGELEDWVVVEKKIDDLFSEQN
jgi:hypothetical protein